MELEYFLTEIDNKSKAIINIGPQYSKMTSEFEHFDLLLFSSLNRTVNINRAFSDLMRNNNFIAAAPLVRINLDTLLRLYAARISEFNINQFALEVRKGKHIRNMKAFNSKEKLTDTYLVKKMAEIEKKEWVEQIYQAGNSFVHFCDNIISSSEKIVNSGEKTILTTIGFHDSFIPDDQKLGAVIWMNKTVDAIIEQVQIRMYERSKELGFDIEKLNK